MPSHYTGRYDDRFLEAKRQIGDPACDKVLAQVFANHKADEVNALLRHLDENKDLVPEEMPPKVAAFLRSSAALPRWARPDLMREGSRIFSRYVPHIVVALHCASLPECYAAAKGVQVLYITKRLSKYTYRRIMETAQFVLDVMAADGMAPEGHGVRTVQKVRLLHATIRLHLRAHVELPREDGVAINQEDLAGTLMAFSVCVVDALEMLSITLTPAEREAYLHLWTVVGALLGIDQDLLPDNYARAQELTKAIRRRQWRSSEAGRDLTAALIEYMKYITPGNFFDGFPAVLMRHFLGDQGADLLGVPPADWTDAFLAPYRLFCGITDNTTDHVAMLARLTEILGRKTLEAMHWMIRGGQRYEIRIPKDVREQWGITER